jgi:hypothetical protein
MPQYAEHIWYGLLAAGVPQARDDVSRTAPQRGPWRGEGASRPESMRERRRAQTAIHVASVGSFTVHCCTMHAMPASLACRHWPSSCECCKMS